MFVDLGRQKTDVELDARVMVLGNGKIRIQYSFHVRGFLKSCNEIFDSLYFLIKLL